MYNELQENTIANQYSYRNKIVLMCLDFLCLFPQGKEWLCLNCQMQRAVGGMEPPMMKQPPRQGSAPPSPQRIEPPSGSPLKVIVVLF